MVEIAARSTKGVKFMSHKQTRKEIIRMFKEQMKALKERLNVRPLDFNITFSYLSTEQVTWRWRN